MLTVDSVVSFLLRRGLIPPSWIVDGPLTIRGDVRRNRNFIIEGPGQTGYFLKQPEPDGSSDRGHATLRREAAFHDLCRQELDFSPMAQLVGRLVDCEIAESILVYELISDATGLSSLLDSRDHQHQAAGGAVALGSALARLHRLSRAAVGRQATELRWLPQDLPWVIRLHRPGPSLLADLSPATWEILRILQTETSFVERLDPCCARWRPEAVIHGDVRFSNVLIRPGPDGGAGPTELWIVDWELVQIGDPAWDLAGALQDLLVTWVGSMPLTNASAVEQFVAGARVPTDSIRIASRALWRGYREEAGLEETERGELLGRAVAFSAVRLIQSAFELALSADQLAGESVILMQLSANILADPERAQEQLFGIL